MLEFRGRGEGYQTRFTPEDFARLEGNMPDDRVAGTLIPPSGKAIHTGDPPHAIHDEGTQGEGTSDCP